jgi:hypothetical protein
MEEREATEGKIGEEKVAEKKETEMKETDETTGREEKETSKETKEGIKTKKKMSPLVWISIAAIIIIAIFAVKHFTKQDDDNPFDLPPGEEEIYYNSFKFVKIEGLWYTQWQKDDKLYTIPLRFNPREVENIPVEGELDFDIFNSIQDVYITFDLSDEETANFSLMALASTELTQNLVKAINRNPIAACINNESEACHDRPIISCDDNGVPVIFIREQSPTKLILDDNCMILQGEGMELLKVVDNVLYKWYGIIS